jgi:hypothetical protein
MRITGAMYSNYGFVGCYCRMVGRHGSHMSVYIDGVYEDYRCHVQHLRVCELLLQEWWGVTDEIKSQAEHLKTGGYRVLVPDLYKGKLGVDAEEAGHVRSLHPSQNPPNIPFPFQHSLPLSQTLPNIRFPPQHSLAPQHKPCC